MGIVIGSGIAIGGGINIGGGGGPTRTPKNIAVTGAVITQSTANQRFGTSSLYNSGEVANYLEVTPYEGFAFGLGDFTIEWWVYPTNDSSFQCMIGFRPSGSNGQYMSLNLDYPSIDTIGNFTDNFTEGIFFNAAPGAVPNNTWNSIALVQSSGTVQWYVNGQASGLPRNLLDTQSWVDGGGWQAQSCIIACDDYTRNDGPLIGYMDELRISNVARYTSNYTPATQAFVNDANTLLLLHFDGLGQNIVDDGG